MYHRKTDLELYHLGKEKKQSVNPDVLSLNLHDYLSLVLDK